MEKSASTHSDSSGFADVDTTGEINQSSLDISKVRMALESPKT